jgi:hypothetical protein
MYAYAPQRSRASVAAENPEYTQNVRGNAGAQRHPRGADGPEARSAITNADASLEAERRRARLPAQPRVIPHSVLALTARHRIQALEQSIRMQEHHHGSIRHRSHSTSSDL